MSENWTIRRIVTDWLKSHNYDGLVDEYGMEGCSCLVSGDFMPCQEPDATCRAGAKAPCDCTDGEEHEYHMVAVAAGEKPRDDTVSPDDEDICADDDEDDWYKEDAND